MSCQWECFALREKIIQHIPLQVLLLLAGVGVLTAMSLISNLLWLDGSTISQGMRLLFGVDQEMSLPTWWSSTTLAGLGVLTWFVMRSRRHDSKIEQIAWILLAFGFLFLSIDEACMLHERIGGMIQSDGLYMHARWIILWLPMGGIVGCFVLWKLWRSSRSTVIGLVIGAVVFLSGAVGMEFFNAVHRRQMEYKAELLTQELIDQAQQESPELPAHLDKKGKRNLPYIAGTAAEELLEMLGVVFWYGVMLRAREESLGMRVSEHGPDAD